MARRQLNKKQKTRLENLEHQTHWLQGHIIARFGKSCALLTDQGELTVQIPAKFQGNTQVEDLVVGDWVYFDPETAIIEARCARTTELVRYRRPTTQVAKTNQHQCLDSLHQARGKVVAANITQLCIVIAPRPFVDTLTIDEYLLAAHMQGFVPLIISNKSDLAAANSSEYKDYIASYESLGFQVVRSSATAHIDPELQAQLQEHTSVFMGTSGVGKSSLLNMLIGEEIAKTGVISEGAALGKHTTTTARLYHLPNGGTLIDAPGIREFKLAVAQPFDLFHTYADLYAGQACQFSDCSHREEPNCAVQHALATGQAFQWRYNNYKILYETLVEGKIQPKPIKS